jgi:hypothetical protein
MGRGAVYPWSLSAHVLSDEEPSAHQAFLVVGHLQPTVHQDVGDLLGGKQPQFMTLNVVLRAYWRPNQVMQVEIR